MAAGIFSLAAIAFGLIINLMIEPLLEYLAYFEKIKRRNEIITIVVPHFISKQARSGFLNKRTAAMLQPVYLVTGPGVGYRFRPEGLGWNFNKPVHRDRKAQRIIKPCTSGMAAGMVLCVLGLRFPTQSR